MVGKPFDAWAGPPNRIEIGRSRESRGAFELHDLLGDRIGVESEQDAIIHVIGDWVANQEASGMPPQIADSLREMLDDGGGMLLAPGDSGFVLIRPEGSGMRFDTTETAEGHRIMDISELSPDEMAAALEKVDQQTLVDVIVRMTAQRDDLDAASGLVDLWVKLHESIGLSLAAVFEDAIERGLVTGDELQAAVDEAIDS